MGADINGRALIAGTVPGSALKDNAEINRSQMRQETTAAYMVPLTSFRVWDNMAALLPTAGATDDLGLIEGTFGSASPTLQTEDLKAEGGNPTLNYARALFQLPPEYDAGETVILRIHAGMTTTVADDTATVDVVCYESDKETGIGSDICATAAQSINSTTFADKDFTITSTGLAPGDVLDFRIATSVSDAATGTAVIATIGQVEFILDIRG